MFAVVDSVEEVLIQFTLASLCNWREGQKNTHTTFKKKILSLGNFGPKQKTAPEEKDELQEIISPGSLIMEPYEWRTLQGSTPVLQVVTSGIKGTTLRLPPG